MPDQFFEQPIYERVREATPKSSSSNATQSHIKATPPQSPVPPRGKNIVQAEFGVLPLR
jgi:hypothetical protein